MFLKRKNWGLVDIKASRRAVFLTISGLIAACLGLALGVGLYTFFYAKGASYLSSDPNACANCHVMREVLHDWQSGDHKHVAGCNDCHVPAHPVGKWLVKGLNGVHHSYAFTFKDTPVSIEAAPLSKQIVQQNCLRCHGNLIPNEKHFGKAAPGIGTTNTQSCITCHKTVGHWH